jgi:GET complex subunit GET2
MLLGLVLPYLPPPFPQAILTSLRYLQMGSMVLDDLSILVFGIGLVIFVSNWAT